MSSSISEIVIELEEKAFRDGVRNERERIIKLLADQPRRVFQDSYTDENYADTAIALIKGEHK